MLYLYYADLFLQYLHSNAYTVLFAGTDAAPVAGTPVGVKDNLFTCSIHQMKDTVAQSTYFIAI